MPPNRSTLGMALLACCSGALLGAQWPGLAVPAGDSQSLHRYTGFVYGWAPHALVASVLAWGVTRLGGGVSKARLGPNALLNLFHDGNALVGTALAIALHGGSAAWPLVFATVGHLLVSTCQALHLRRGMAAAVVWTYAAAALAFNSMAEGAGAAYWCTHLLGAGPAAARCLPLALALDSFVGVAPAYYTIGITFRFTLMRFVSWALDTLDGRVMEATRPGAVERAYPAAGSRTHNNGSSTHVDGGAPSESPRIAAMGGAGGAGANTAAFEYLDMLSSPTKVHAISTAGLASATWIAYLSYMFFAPLYLVGPVISAADYYQQGAAVTAGRSTTSRTMAGSSCWRAVARCLGFCAFAEAARRTLLADPHALLAAQTWQAWAVGYGVLTALFAQSFVPWTFSRLCAGALGIATPDEAPVGFLRSSVTPATFWRNFHTSWYRWLRQYVYIPLGATPAALVLTLAVSTLLHGTHRAWLLWGAIQCGALLAERALAPRQWLMPGLHPHLRAALVQCATQTTLLVQLPLGPSLWKFLLCFHAINLPFLALNAARLAGREAGGKGSMADPLATSAKLAAAAKVALD